MDFLEAWPLLDSGRGDGNTILHRRPGVDSKVMPARLVSNLVVISKVAHLSTTWCKIRAGLTANKALPVYCCVTNGLQPHSTVRKQSGVIVW